jgi:2-polyprenyl-3-methyl-5-hydroxy-6-metoxy-1,4-benzoquinol methylase
MSPLLSEFLTKRRINAVTPYLKGKILDLGCGYSRIPPLLSSKQSYVGVETNPQTINWLEKKFPEHTFYQRNLDLEPISIDEKFDTIIMTAILEHLKKPEFVMAQLVRYLNPNGKIYLTTPTPLGGILHSLGSRLGLVYVEAANEHETFFDRKSFHPLAKASGLKIGFYQKFLFFGNQLICCQPLDGAN